jgi:signal transduction histidine kinase/CheY-like chemotaxis protein/sensor domain CHASE-containing protein
MHRITSRWGRRWLPWFVLAVGLVCTALVTRQFYEVTRAKEQQRIQSSTTQLRDTIMSRLDTYVALLYATAGFFAANPNATPLAFRAFVDQLPLPNRYSGVEGVGFAQVAAPRAPARVPIVYLEPASQRNWALIGLDAASRAEWSEAMEFARVRRVPAFTTKVRFPRELDDGQREGFLVFLPVYRGDGGVLRDGQPDEEFAGYAFLMLHSNTLFRGMLGRLPQERLTVTLHDGADPAPENLLYRGGVVPFADGAGLVSLNTTIQAPPQNWTLTVSTLYPFADAGIFGLPGYIALLGSLITLLLFSLMWAQVAARAEAETSVEERLRSEEALRELNETLERRVAERATEAERRAAQLHSMAVQLTEAEQRERRRIAQVLHDDLQQILVAARLRIERLLRRAGNREQAEELVYADELLSQGIQSARSLSVDLSPPILRERGLAPALEWLARKMQLEHGLEVHLDVQEDVAPDNEDAKYFLLQAVRELLFNVVKHAGVTHAHVRLAPVKEPFLKIVVEDEGTGFDPKAAGRGGGVDEHFGLYSIQQRLELIGGEAEIESAPGRGTRITLYVPRQLEPPVTAPPPAPAPAQARAPELAAANDGHDHDEAHKIRVLLVDDHKIVRQGLAGLLRGEQDIELVGEASDGIMALEMVRESQPDVVVMDVTMPRMNGIEATRHITSEFPGIRVIGLSMHEKDDMEAAMHEAGAETYLSKDGASTALVEAIRGAEARLG